jgi:hypothetical protein
MTQRYVRRNRALQIQRAAAAVALIVAQLPQTERLLVLQTAVRDALADKQQAERAAAEQEAWLKPVGP